MIVRPSRAPIWVMTSCLSWCETWSTWWSMVVTLAVDGATECVTGSARYCLTSLLTSPSSVAENSSRWPLLGVRSRISRTCGMKPMSAIWSASSSAMKLQSPRFAVPCRTWSERRPGVAMSRSTPRESASAWRAKAIPPTAVRHHRPRDLASGVSESATCIASSRVGTRTSARGRFGRALPSASRASMARPNARVLPEPVWARPSTSRPARASGMVAVWIGNGVVMPDSASAREQRLRQAQLSERSWWWPLSRPRRRAACRRPAGRSRG